MLAGCGYSRLGPGRGGSLESRKMNIDHLSIIMQKHVLMCRVRGEEQLEELNLIEMLDDEIKLSPLRLEPSLS